MKIRNFKVKRKELLYLWHFMWGMVMSEVEEMAYRKWGKCLIKIEEVSCWKWEKYHTMKNMTWWNSMSKIRIGSEKGSCWKCGNIRLEKCDMKERHVRNNKSYLQIWGVVSWQLTVHWFFFRPIVSKISFYFKHNKYIIYTVFA